MAQYIDALPPREYLRRYLKITPLALAIFRSIEAKHIATIPMKRPILDLGCGFGEFAGVFFNSQVEAGLDISWKELLTAMKSNLYKNLTCIDARNMPYEDNTFATVLSVSVLEHIPVVHEVIGEVYRVLKPGGQFIFTVNASYLETYLYYPALFRRYGLIWMAQLYITFYHRIFRHVTLWNMQKWKKVLIAHGFQITSAKKIISPEATRFFDKMLITSWPSQIIKVLIGKRWAWRPYWFREWLVSKYASYVEVEETTGSNLFFVAVKQKHPPLQQKKT